MESLAAGGVLDVRGLQQPDSAWIDNVPSQDPTDLSPSTVVEARYEIRWWSRRGDHQAADVFVFSSRGDATRFVRRAASSRCRREAASYPFSQSSGGRALVWNNPVGALEADLFFARGNRAYRLVEVPPGAAARGPSDLNVQQLLQIPQQLACRLKDAACWPAPSKTSRD